jgi:hypothetical protein
LAVIIEPRHPLFWRLRTIRLLRVKAEFPSRLWPNAVQAYYRWIRTALYENMSYDQFANTLLTSSGSNFREGPVNFYRAMPSHSPEEIARPVRSADARSSGMQSAKHACSPGSTPMCSVRGSSRAERG